MKFSSKMTILFALLAISTSIILSYVVYSSASENLKNANIDRLNDHAYHTLAKMDELFHGALEDTSLLANSVSFNINQSVNGSSSHVHGLARVRDKLVEFRNSGMHYESVTFYNMDRVSLADSEGRVIKAGKRLPDYWKYIKEGKDLVMDLSISELTGKEVFHFASVVKDNTGKRAGVVVARADGDKILKGIVNDFWGFGRYSVPVEGEAQLKEMDIELVGAGGRTLFSIYHSSGIKNHVSPYWGVVKPVVEAGKKFGNFTAIMQGDEPKTMMGVFVKEPGFNDFKGNGWMLVASAPEVRILAPVVGLRNLLFMIAAAGGLIGAALVYAYTYVSIRPLKRLNAAVASLKRGNFNAKVEVNSRDEVGDLAQAFNDMSAELKARMEEKERYATELHGLNYVLQKSLKEVKILKGLLPICSSCKKIRSESGEWNSIERYISKHSDAEFTHGICPECAFKLATDEDYKN